MPVRLGPRVLGSAPSPKHPLLELYGRKKFTIARARSSAREAPIRLRSGQAVRSPAEFGGYRSRPLQLTVPRHTRIVRLSWQLS
jgi:hypothetical protein